MTGHSHGGISVFGMEDVQIQPAHALAIGAASLCAAYGVAQWNEVD
jgi:hypothetical protein